MATRFSITPIRLGSAWLRIGGRMLADLDGNGVFDVGEGVVVNLGEPFVDGDADAEFDLDDLDDIDVNLPDPDVRGEQNVFFAFLPGAGGRQGSFYVNHVIPHDQVPELAATTSGRYEDSIIADLIPTLEEAVSAQRVRF